MGGKLPLGGGSFASRNEAAARPFRQMNGGAIPILPPPLLKAVRPSLSGHSLRKARTVSCRSQAAAQQGAAPSSSAAGPAWETQSDLVGEGHGGGKGGGSGLEHGVPRGRGKKRGAKTAEELKKEVSVIMIQLYTLEEEGDRKLHHVFRKYARVFGSDAVMGALWEIIRRQNVDQALEALEAVRSSHWYTPDPQIYASLIRLLARNKRTRDAEDLFFAMPEHQCPPSTAACTALLDAYANRGDVLAARKLLEEMKQDPGSFPDSTAYSAVMRGYCRRGEMAEAEALLREMQANGVEADVVAFNVVLDGYARLGKVAKLKEIYARLAAANREPDLFTFNALLRGFARGGHTSEMEAVFVSMQAQHNVAPNNQSYHCLVEGYALWGHSDKLLRTLQYMRLLRYRPGAATWNTAIGSLSAVRRPLHVWQIQFLHCCFCTAILDSHGGTLAATSMLNVFMLDAAVRFCCSLCSLIGQAGRISEMERVHALMKQQRARPTPLTFLHLVCGYESAACALRSCEPGNNVPIQTSGPAREHACAPVTEHAFAPALEDASAPDTEHACAPVREHASVPAREDAEPEPPAGARLGGHEAAAVAARVKEPGAQEAEAMPGRALEPGCQESEAMPARALEPGGREAAALAGRVSKLEGLNVQMPASEFSHSGTGEPEPAAAGRMIEAQRAPANTSRRKPRSPARIDRRDSWGSSEGGQALLSAEAIKQKISAVLRHFEVECSDRDMRDPRVYRAALSAYSALGASKEISELVAKIQK